MKLLRNLFKKKRKPAPDDSGIDTRAITYIDPDDVIAVYMSQIEKDAIRTAVEYWNGKQLNYTEI